VPKRMAISKPQADRKGVCMKSQAKRRLLLPTIAFRRGNSQLPWGLAFIWCLVAAAANGTLLLLASCPSLSAQNVVLTGSLSGRVSDPSGAIVPGATIMVRSLATGVQQTSVTNHAGLYRFPALMPGTYSVTASPQGFRDIQVLVRVQVGNTTSQDIKLQ